MTRTLEMAAREASTCTRCALSEGRTQVVFGSGPTDAALMFVGEAPGFHEDRKGEPFVGAAGGLLNGLLEGIGLSRGDVYIANTLKCLRYSSLVQLGDGSWERIGRLVRSRYAGDVMAVDEDGRLVSRRVIGWHTSPLGGRRVFRVTYRSAKAVGRSKVNVNLTGDHEVLTERGWVAVQELRSGDRIATGQGLSALERDVVCGTLLGDGSVNKDSSYLSFNHSAKQRDYAAFKASLLDDLAPRTVDLSVAVGGVHHDVVQVRTLAHRALGYLRQEFYGPRKRVPTWIGEELNARMLALWFMDDGYLRLRFPRRPSAEIATCSFEDDDLVVLRTGLARLGLDAKVSRGRLHFDAEETRKLSELIAPYVPESMRYKVHPDAAQRIPFDGSMFVAGPRRVMFDDVEATDITDRPRSDTTFFCIDVENEHNFVTAGGVVHNCRPPSNRNPLPGEIDACKPWLKEQIEIVDPAVICTLGNFASKLLLGTSLGISKVRGRRIPWRGRTLIPTFHPAAVLHSGRNSDTMTAMQQDFRLIATVLDERSVETMVAPVDISAEQLGLF